MKIMIYVIIEEKLFNFLQLHRSHDELKMSSFLETSNKKLMNSCSEESRGCIDIDLCAPDTLDVQGTCNLCLYSKK